MECHLGYGKSNLDLRGPGGDGGGESGWVYVGATAVKMVLGKPNYVVTKLLG